MKNLQSEKLLDLKSIIKAIGVEQEMVVADLGCGSNGHFVFPLADVVGKKGKVYAVDVLKKCTDNVKRKTQSDNYQNIKVVWGDLEVYKGIKIESGSLDVALLVNVLHQSNHTQAIIREAVRMLKKDAKLVVVDWEKGHIPFGPEKDNRVSAEHLKQIAQKQGLSFEGDFFVGNYHYGLIFHKL